MSNVDKVLKKAQQERGKGQLEKALNRLKDALEDNPSEFVLAREAASLAFEMGRALEGVSYLRALMRRSPDDRPFALDMLQAEYEHSQALEVGEFLFEAYLAVPDFDKAGDVVSRIPEADRARMLQKLEAKIQAVRDNTPDDHRRLVFLLLSRAMLLSGMQHHEEAVTSLGEVLDLDVEQTRVVGRLCKAQLQHAPDNAALRLLLGRCYMQVGEADLAAEQLLKVGDEDTWRGKALRLLRDGAHTESPRLLLARAHLQLVDGDHAAALRTLEDLLEAHPESASRVRRTLERVPGVNHATLGLRLLYARVLGESSALPRAVQELREAREAAAGDPLACVATVEALLAKDPRHVELLELRGLLELDAGRPDTAVVYLRQVLELEPRRADAWIATLEKAQAEHPESAALAAFMVDVHLGHESPAEAARVLVQLRAGGQRDPQVLFEPAARIAERYGFTAELLLVFVEAAVDLGHRDDAAAAARHYLTTPGARTAELSSGLSRLLEEREDLGPRLAAILEGLPLTDDVRLALMRARLRGDDADGALQELEVLVARRPALRRAALELLQDFAADGETRPEVLILQAQWLVEEDHHQEAAEGLAQALRLQPEVTDRILQIAEGVVAADPGNDAVWRPLLLALIDVDRLRHARELAYRAGHALPPQRAGFVHLVEGFVHLGAGQAASATQAFESVLACEDVPVDRLLDGLQRAAAIDPQHGHTHLVLARVLLGAGDRVPEALECLRKAAQCDRMLSDSVLELLVEHREAFAAQPAARILEAGLLLDGNRTAEAVERLDAAVEADPSVAPDALPYLERVWDENPEDVATGLVLARAQRLAGQGTRAARLLADLAKRFAAAQPRVIAELQHLVADDPTPEARRTLWQIHLDRGEQQAALAQIEAALEDAATDPEAQMAVLETAHTSLPEIPELACRLAALELRHQRAGSGMERLRAVLEQRPASAPEVLEVLGASGILGDGDGVPEPEAALLEVDALVAAGRFEEARARIATLRDQGHVDAAALLQRLETIVEHGDTGGAADVDLALLLQECGRTDESVRVLEGALRTLADLESKDPDLVRREREIRLALASLYVDLGRERDGKNLLASVLDTEGEHDDAYEFLQKVTEKNLAAKVKQLQATLGKTPGNLRARLELARLALVRGDFGATREALSFSGDSPALEASRRYLLARSYDEEGKPHMASAVLRSIDLEDVGDAELRRNVLYLLASCNEKLGMFAEAHALFLQLLSEFPAFKDIHERVRRSYQKYLETGLETRALVLEKHTGFQQP